MSGVPPTYPFRVDLLELGRNGQVPDARFINPIGNAQNHICTYRRKEVFHELGVASATGGATMLRGYFHSGHASSALCFKYALGTAAHSGADPRITINLQPAAGGPILSATIHSPPQVGSTSIMPSDLQYSERYFSLSADTNYTWWITATDLPYLASLLIYEVGAGVIDTTVNYFVGGANGYSSIYDANRQRMHQGLSGLWKHNGATILNWSRASSSSVTSSSVTWTNMFDGTTAVAATSAGFAIGSNRIAPYCRQSESIAGIMPMATLAVYGSQAGGGGGGVRLMTDAAVGSPTLCSVAINSSTPQWFVSNQRLGAGNFGPNAFTKADLQLQASGFGTLDIEAVALFLYET